MGAGVATNGWLVLYTKPRTEKKLSERLERQGFQVYCPLKTVLRQWSDRKKKVQVPIFPSYVFVKPENEAERQKILFDPQAVNYVYWLGKPAVVSEKEMTEVQTFLQNGLTEGLDIDCVQIGQDIEIDAGVFKGQTGVVKSVTSSKLVLELTQIGVQLIMNRK